MGVKMNKARDYFSPDTIVTTKDCDRECVSKYICVTDNCYAKLSFMPRHERRYVEKVIEVSSFFKLKKGETHELGLCPYNTLGVVEIIAKDSDPDIIRSLSDKKYEFSLQILHLFDKQNKNIKDSILDTKSAAHPLSKQKKYVRKGRLSTYINKLHQILKLRSEVESNRDLSQILYFNYSGRKVAWKNFYFEVGDYSNAFKNIVQKNKKHPVCIHGRVNKVHAPTEKFNYYSVKLLCPRVDSNNDTKVIPSVNLIFPEHSICSEIISGCELLAYGIVTGDESGPWSPPNENKAIIFQNIKMWINHQEQILILR
jgi:hypothetical protein